MSVRSSARADLYRAAGHAAAPLLCLLPALHLAPHLAAGRIPFFMDPVMYFLPLRIRAADLIASGQLPLWNRTLLAGMPLFSNPQAAIGYPAHWPFLLHPCGALWLLPQALQFGLWIGFSFSLLRRRGVATAAALFTAGILLAGDYGWGRLQYGNYMNALPWWPLWLAAGLSFADSPGRRPAVAGAAAVAMSLLSGAHQPALYGLSMSAIALCAASRSRVAVGRIIAYFALSGIFGTAISAPGWMPQTAFLAETSRAAGLSSREILAGTFSGLSSVVSALIENVTPAVADAEASAAVGLLALAAATIAPPDSDRRRLWQGLWAAIIISSLFTLEPVTRLLLTHVPFAESFHGPRRMIGVTHWLLALAAGLGADGLVAGERRCGALKSAIRFLPAIAITVIGVWIQLAEVRGREADGFLPALLPGAVASVWLALLVSPSVIPPRLVSGAGRPRKMLLALLPALALCLLAASTLRTTDFAMISYAELVTPMPPAEGMTARRPDGRPVRFVAMDDRPASSYDYRRADRAARLLPNLGAVRGLEDLGGYEPARSVRYERWFRSLNAWPGGVQPWERNFALVFPSGANADELARAGVGFAILPSAGAALYLRPVESDGDGGLYGTLLPPDAGRADLTIRFTPSDSETGTSVREIQLHGGGGRPEVSRLDDSNRDSFTDGVATHRVSADLPGNVTSAASAQPPYLIIRLAPGDSAPEAFLFSDELRASMQPAGEGSDEADGPRDASGPRLFALTAPDRWAAIHREADRATIPFHLEACEVRANRIELRTRREDAGGAILTLRDAWWPGWSATVNGAAVEVRPSGPGGDGPWRTIALPPLASAGSRADTIVLTYRPPLLVLSLAISAAGFAFTVWMLFRGSRIYQGFR